jgi:hypothetical protein
MERRSENPDAGPRDTAGARKNEFLTIPLDAEDREPLRPLKIESRSTNTEAVDNELVNVLMSEDFSLRLEADPTDAPTVTKRPLTYELARLKEEARVLNRELCLERLELEPSDVVSPTIRPLRMAPERPKEPLRFLR